eukprot:5530-Heterococcus_DN1.PRE.3
MSRVFKKKGVFELYALSCLQLAQSILSKLDSFAKGALCRGSVLYTVFYDTSTSSSSTAVASAVAVMIAAAAAPSQHKAITIKYKTTKSNTSVSDNGAIVRAVTSAYHC